MLKMIEMQNLPKIELKHFIAYIIPGMIISIISLLLLCTNYRCFIPNNITSITNQSLVLLLLYLIISGLFFGIVLMFIVLLLKPFCEPKEEAIQNKDEREAKRYIGNFRGEIRDKVLESYDIDISYKNTFRIFFGNTAIASIFVVLSLLFIFRIYDILLLLILVLFILFYCFAYYKLTKDVINTPVDLIYSLAKIDIGKNKITKKDIDKFIKNRLRINLHKYKN